MKIVFLGTPDFAVPTLEKIVGAGHEVGFVITQPDRPGNRGKVIASPVKRKALELGIEVLQPEKISEVMADERFTAYEPDAAVVVAYGQILKKDFLSYPRLGCYNVHGSLLPKLRGASPMQRAILDGDEYAGVTIMKVDEGLDSGDMLISGKTEVDHKNFEDIHDELSEMGAELMVEALSLIENGEAEFTPQDESEATYAGLIKKSDGKIDFSLSSVEIERKIRAFDPWPGAFADLSGSSVKILKADALDDACDNTEAAPGTVTSVERDRFIVKCGKGSLSVTEIQMPGKKRTGVKDWLLGHKMDSGLVLG